MLLTYAAILEAKGDILKFAGDALLAFWSCSQYAASTTFNHVLKQSLAMQNIFNNSTAPNGTAVRIKIGLGVGCMNVHHFGKEEYKAFAVTGECVDGANAAQAVARPGTVIVSKEAWELCEKDKCFGMMVGKGCVMVR